MTFHTVGGAERETSARRLCLVLEHTAFAGAIGKTYPFFRPRGSGRRLRGGGRQSRNPAQEMLVNPAAYSWPFRSRVPNDGRKPGRAKPSEKGDGNAQPFSFYRSLLMADTKDKVKDAIDNTADAAKKATDKVSDKVKEGAQKTGEAVENAGKKIKKTGK
jgi:hypothetical protein